MRGDISLSTLGQYEILERIGAGGMGAVYRAYQPALDRHVAVKVLISNHAQETQFFERFRREARAIAKLDHPNILPIFDFGDQDGCLYIVMPLVTGGTLRDRMEPGGIPAQVLRSCLQLADALDYAHGLGIVHRDVKPANVLIGQGERPLLADFGIAKLIGDAAGLTGTGNGIGTPDYMSPEQCYGTEVDQSTDQYALATMVFEMLAGRVPFTGRTGMEIILKKLSDPVPRIRDLNPTLSAEVDAILARALAKGAADRYPSCTELMTELVAALGTSISAGDLGLGVAAAPAPVTVVSNPGGSANIASGRAVPGADQTSSPALDAASDHAIDGLVGGQAASLPLPRRVFPSFGLRLRRVHVALIVLLLVFAIVGPAVATIRRATPQQMTGLFNFAVAEFGQVDERGESVRWDNGARLSQSLVQRLEKEFRGISTLTGIAQVRHDGVGLVPGKTAPERTAAAARVAEQMKAHLIIYGNLERQGNQVAFAPEFYVTGLEGAEELLGASRLGTPVVADAGGENLGYALVLSDTLKARSEALTLFTVGLTYLAARQPGSAIAFFEQARAVPLWADSDGKEVVYLFLGTAHRMSGQAGDLERAGEAFLTAARLNPEYARAYLGLGNVYYETFKRSDHGNEAFLDQAITYYERAGTAKIKPETAFVDAKARVNLGNAYVVKAQLQQNGQLYARAQDHYQQVVTEYERGEHRIQTLAAQSYLGMGVVHESWTGDSAQAAEHYRKALAIAVGNREVEQLARERLSVLGATPI